jgi:hypothetical protein
MKTRSLLAIFLLSCFVLSAQEASNEKGKNHDYFVGGNLFFNTNDGSGNAFTSLIRTVPFITPLGGSRNTILGVSPYVAKQHNDQWAYGAGLDFSLNRISGLTSLIDNEIISSTQTTMGYSAYFFTRYTIANEQKLKVFIQPAIGVSRISRNIEFEDSPFSAPADLYTTNVFFSTSLGLQYNISNRFRLLANLGDFTALL